MCRPRRRPRCVALTSHALACILVTDVVHLCTAYSSQLQFLFWPARMPLLRAQVDKAAELKQRLEDLTARCAELRDTLPLASELRVGGNVVRTKPR